jgi:hypothetical protein
MANTTDRDSENLAPPPEPEGGVTVACNVCGDALEMYAGEKVISTFEQVNDVLTREHWYHEKCFAFVVPARSEQLESQIGSQQGPWSSVELHKNSKGFTHDLKLYFPPEWSAADVETRLKELQGVIEKLESIGSEGRHAIE